MKSPPTRPCLEKAKDYAALCEKVTTKISELAGGAIKARGRFSAALCGGSTPEGIYKALSNQKLDWTKIDLFLGDERWVPLDHPRSNYKMITRALGAAAGRVHPVPVSAGDPAATASLYGKELTGYFNLKPGEFPVFDAMLLGIGEDGHTASLFPGTAALKEKNALAVALEPSGIPEPRVSLTLPVINNARCIMFAVSGASKVAILKKIFSGGPDLLPAQMVVPAHGELIWFVDEPAQA